MAKLDVFALPSIKASENPIAGRPGDARQEESLGGCKNHEIVNGSAGPVSGIAAGDERKQHHVIECARRRAGRRLGANRLSGAGLHGQRRQNGMKRLGEITVDEGRVTNGF
jgi:hypothetical protein